jgi:hypothetical protein
VVRKKRKPKFTQRVSLGLRVSPDLKEKLDAAAEHTGRSQSTEAAVRLERSFDRQDLLSDALTLAFGQELAGLLMMLGHVMGPSGYVTVHQKERSLLPFSLGQWTYDPAAYDQAVQGAMRVLNALRPPGEVPKPAADRGVQIADQMIRAVGGGPIDTIPKLAAPKICELLGSIADRCRDFESGQQSELRSPKRRGADTDHKRLGTQRAAERQNRLVPLLTFSEAIELSAFKNWDTSRFQSAELIRPRFTCGPRSFALRIRNSDDRPSWHKGDILILDPDECPRVGDWILAKIDGRPRLAELCSSKDDSGRPTPAAITSDAGVHPAECARAVVTESTRGRPAAARIAAAQESGRSLNQETELQLERSFDRQEVLPEVLTLAYGQKIAGELMQLGAKMKARVDNGDHPYELVLAVMKSAFAICDLAGLAGKPPQRGERLPQDKVKGLLESELKDFLLPDWGRVRPDDAEVERIPQQDLQAMIIEFPRKARV